MRMTFITKCAAREKKTTTQKPWRENEKCMFVLENDKLTFSIAVNSVLPMQFSTIIIYNSYSVRILCVCVLVFRFIPLYSHIFRMCLDGSRRKSWIEMNFQSLGNYTAWYERCGKPSAFRQIIYQLYVLCVCISLSKKWFSLWELLKKWISRLAFVYLCILLLSHCIGLVELISLLLFCFVYVLFTMTWAKIAFQQIHYSYYL